MSGWNGTGGRNARRDLGVGLLAVVGLALVAAGCGSSKKAASTTTAPSTTVARGSGPVDVLYAGSLLNAMSKQIGPAFNAATGYTFTGMSGDSGTLANQILNGTSVADVFISASPAKNMVLEGTAGKNLVSWYASWSTSPVVLGYNPASKFASDIRTKPWYQVLTEPGILVGRTDPVTDPKGALTVTALNDAATTYNEPALKTVATDSSNVFPETTLVGRLQAGQLDVGFFYAAEAAASNIMTVPLTGENEAATYTVTILSNAAHQAGAEAFVKYLVGPQAKPVLSTDGFNLISPPMASGTGIPASLNSVIP